MPDSKVMTERYSVTKTLAKETIALTRKSRGVSMAAGLAGQGQAQWEDIMKKFYKSHTVTCKATPTALPKTARNLKRFPTGSTYTGDWTPLGMNGKGTYTFPKGGITYKGGFTDGAFDGHGELQYEATGAVLKGKFDNGKMVQQTLIFANGLHYDEDDWGYLRYPDRRYVEEIDNGIPPAGASFITPEKPSKQIPPGWYDCGDGVYNPVANVVFKHDDLTALIRSPHLVEQKWIMSNCRCNKDLAIGPCTFLYEEWKMPLLDSENPPDPMCHTKTQTGVVEERGVGFSGHGRKSSSRSSRASRASRASRSSRASRISYVYAPLFAKQFNHRRVSQLDSNTLFYIPPDLVKSVSKINTRSKTSLASLSRQKSSRASLRSKSSHASNISVKKSALDLDGQSTVSYTSNITGGSSSVTVVDDYDSDYDYDGTKPKTMHPLPNW